MEGYNPELCDRQHQELDRRMTTMEQALKESAKTQEDRLARIHQRFDEVAKDLMNRLPPWVTIVIGLLTAACAGLGVAAVK